MTTTQIKIPFSKSLEGTDEQIKINMLCTEHVKTGLGVGALIRAHTGLTTYKYLRRPFKRLMYYEWKRQQMKWKKPTLNFWDL